ncbi:MAG: FimV/HubP family polar landmark protein [Gammaproteobacteria bacterium]
MRKIARGVALSLLLTPGMAWSLGLGDISVDTGLNQALQAEIELLSVRPSDIEGMQITLAGPEAFERAGIDRPVILNKLEFEPVLLENDRGAIRVTTSDPVREPFLNFLVEVRWPKGRLLREYTLLLDPPVLMEQRPVAGLQAPVVTPEPALTQEPATIEVAPAPAPAPLPEPFLVEPPEEISFTEPDAPTVGITEPAPAEPTQQPEITFSEQPQAITFTESTETIGEAPAAVPEEVTIVFDETAQDGQPQPVFQPLPSAESEAIVIAEEASVTEMVPESQFGESNIGPPLDQVAAVEEPPAPGAGDYEVRPGDTLSRVVEAYGQGAGVQQMMLAFLRANPDAFFDSNVNNLRAGAILRVPDTSQALELSRSEAIAEVRRQNALWREFKGLLASQPPTSPAAAAGVAYEEPPDFSDAEEPNIEELLADQTAAGSAVTPGLVTETTPAPAPPAIDDGRLEIVSGESQAVPQEVAQAGVNEDATALEKDLALAKELAESRLQENQDLGEKISELEEMLTKNERIIDLQNEQLAELQQQLSEAEAAEAAQPEAPATETAPTGEAVAFVEEPEAPATTPSEAAEEPTTAVEPDETTEAEPAEQAPETAETTVAAVEPPAQPVVEETTTPEETQPEPQAAATEPTEQEAVVDQDTVVTQADQSTLLQDLFTNPMGLLAAGGAGLLVLSLIWMGIRRSMENRAVTVDLDELKAAEAAQGDIAMPEMGLPSDLLDERAGFQNEEAPTLETPAPDFGALEPSGDTAQVMLTPEDQEALQQAASEQDDIINDDTVAEADVYIAYGLHQQAEELLTNAIAENPERNDYRVKLLETYYGGKDKEKFDTLAQELHAKLNGGTGMLWERVVAMGKEISPGNALFSGADAGGLSVEDFAPRKPESADIDLGADDLGGLAGAGPDFDLSTEQNTNEARFEATQVLGTEELESEIDNPTAEQPGPVGLGVAAAGAAVVGGTLFGANDDGDASTRHLAADESTAQVGDDSNVLEFDMQDFDLDARTVEAPDELSDISTGEGLDFDMSDDETNSMEIPGTDIGAGDVETESLDASIDNGQSTEALDFTRPVSETTDLAFPESEHLDLDEGIVGLDAEPESTQMTQIIDRAEMGLGIDEDTFTGHPTEDGLDIALDSDLSGGVETVLREDVEDDEAIAALDINMDLTEEQPAVFGDSGSFDVEEFSTEEIDMQQATEQLSIPDDIGFDDELPSLEDEVGTKLDLAKAYMDMGDSEGARSTLEEVIKDGNSNQRNEAQELMTQIA